MSSVSGKPSWKIWRRERTGAAALKGGGLVKQAPNQNRKKTGFKIISVILSLLLWFYVVNEGSYGAGQNILSVDLIYENVPEGIQVEGPRQVQVKLWGVFQENQDIKPYVDLEGKKPGVYTLPVRLGAVIGALFTSVEPKNVNVTLLATQETIVPVAKLGSDIGFHRYPGQLLYSQSPD
jgi:hypothetical protein